jgi:hypothetical protein
LKNAPVEFQRVMDQEFLGLEFVKCYIDDIIVFCTSKKKHRAHLMEAFVRLRLHNLKLHSNKYKFYRDHVK